MISITTYEGYKEFIKECKFYFCQDIYEGDWDGKERYFVCSDTPEQNLIEKYPAIMKALSPYFYCDAACGEAFAETQQNLWKYQKRAYITDSLDDPLGPGEMAASWNHVGSDVEAKMMFKEAFSLCTPNQRERLMLFFVDGLSLEQIAGGKYSRAAVYKSITKGIKKIKNFYEGG